MKQIWELHFKKKTEKIESFELEKRNEELGTELEVPNYANNSVEGEN